MPTELITESNAIWANIGLYPEENTLQSGIFQEAPRDRLPVLAKQEDGSYALIARRLELGNYFGDGRGAHKMSAHNVRLVAYDPYFTMSEIGSEFTVHANEGLALRDELKIAKASVHPDMTYGRYKRISNIIEVELLDEKYPTERFYAYELDLTYVSETFNRVDPHDVQLAMDILKDCTHVSEEHRAILKKHMNAPRVDQFELLRSMMKQSQTELIWADTRLTIHTFTALPWDEIQVDKMFASYDGEKVLFFSTVEMKYSFLKKVGEYDSYTAMVDAVTGRKKVGIEWKSLPVGRVLPIGENRCSDISAMLTLWRDRHAYQFLPYYVINGIGTIYAMERACAWAKEMVESGKHATERDVDAKYESLLADFAQKYQLGNLLIKKYFVVLHAGTRCPFPALSSDYVLHKDMKTLKLDGGALLFKNGILMSATDQCRCYNLTPEAQKTYEILGENMRRDVIPNIRGGMTGDEVYWLGLRPLVEKEADLKAMGMLDAHFSLADSYNRNIGHTIDKEESCSVAAEKNEKRCFETNMLGCIEYQWPYRDYCIGVEDMFFIAPEGTINFVY